MKHMILTISPILLVLALMCGTAKYGHYKKASNDWARKHSVLVSVPEMGSCSGVEVKGKSGKHYVMTAAHCRAMKKPGTGFTIEHEDGSKAKARIVYVDPKADIMLLSSKFESSLDIANSLEKHEKVHAMTWGAGHINHRADGEMLEEIEASYPFMAVRSEEDMKRCMISPIYSVTESFFGEICWVKLKSQASTVMTEAGSSGGAVMNERGELVGIVTGGDGTTSHLVKLSDITRVLNKF